jgi:two-component system chemotaxis response regulator CheY
MSNLSDDADLLDDVRTSVDEIEQDLLDYERWRDSGDPIDELRFLILRKAQTVKGLLLVGRRPACVSLIQSFEGLLSRRPGLDGALSRVETSAAFDALDAIRASLRSQQEDVQHLSTVDRVLASAAELPATGVAKGKAPVDKGVSSASVPVTAAAAGSAAGAAPTEAGASAAGAAPAAGTAAPATSPARTAAQAATRAATVPKLTPAPSPALPPSPSPAPLHVLIAEDDFISRSVLLALLRPFGEVEVAVDGREAIAAVSRSLEEKHPYHLICLDIMMPYADGQQVLVEVREMEERAATPVEQRSKVMMTTALSGYEQILQAYERCDSYIVKPIAKAVLHRQLQRLGFQVPAGAEAPKLPDLRANRPPRP